MSGVLMNTGLTISEFERLKLSDAMFEALQKIAENGDSSGIRSQTLDALKRRELADSTGITPRGTKALWFKDALSCEDELRQFSHGFSDMLYAYIAVARALEKRGWAVHEGASRWKGWTITDEGNAAYDALERERFRDALVRAKRKITQKIKPASSVTLEADEAEAVLKELVGE